MSKIVEYTKEEDVEELGIFLRKGLGGPPGASIFADKDILKWKYFDRTDKNKPTSVIIRNKAGEISAHCGANFYDINVPDQENTFRGVFPIDWLSFQPGGGLKLLKALSLECEILYAIGGTEHTFRALKMLDCKKMLDLTVHRLFLSRRAAIDQAFQGDSNLPRKLLRCTRNLLQYKSLTPTTEIRLEPIMEFSINDVPISPSKQYVHTLRSLERLNHLLRHPRGYITGWSILINDKIEGYTLLNANPSKHPATGKILDIQLSPSSEHLRAKVISNCTAQLKDHGAQIAISLCSLSSHRKGFESNYFRKWGNRRLMLRGGGIDDQQEFYLTSLEADLGYE